MRVRTSALAMAMALALAGCGGEDQPEASTPSPSAPASATSDGSAPTAPTEPAFNPCTGLRPGPIGRALGSEVTVEAGTPEAPRCSLLPVVEGGPTMNLTYAYLGIPLAESFGTITPDAGAVVSAPQVAGADDARLIVNVSPEAVAVTGFVENGELIQTVNALALAPYDEPAVIAATELVMAQLSAAAPPT